MKPGVKIALGVFTSLATAGFIFVYDFYIKDRIDSEEVVVVRAGETILKSEIITEDKLSIERRAKDSLIADVVLADEMDKIIGRDSKQEIVGNSMVSTKMIDYDLLIPDSTKAEAIRPITKDMIYAQPGSLRRKDTVDIYLIYTDGSINANSNGPTVATSKNEPKEEEAAVKEDTNENPTENTTSKPEVNLDTKAFLNDVKVVYVKDSGNKEVVSDAKGNGDQRLNGSSVISDLEVILNEDDFSKLMHEVLAKGARLYITYH